MTITSQDVRKLSKDELSCVVYYLVGALSVHSKHSKDTLEEAVNYSKRLNNKHGGQ